MSQQGISGPVGAPRSISAALRAEGTPRWFARLALWLPVVGWVVALGLGVGARPVFDWILREDHPVEWGQFAFILLSCVLALLAARQLSGVAGQRLAVAVLALYVGGSFVLAGEEISWGQRVLNLATPEDLSKVNHQGEINLHNINAGIPVEIVLDLILVVLALVGAVLPVLLWLRRRSLPQVFVTLGPPLVVVPLFGQMLLYQAIASGLTAVKGREYDLVVRFQELPEFCLYLGMAATLLFIYVRARVARQTAEGLDPVRAEAARTRRGRRDGNAQPVQWLSWSRLGAAKPAGIAVAVLTLVLAMGTMISGGEPGNAGEVTGKTAPAAGKPAH
jgi:hypothetical protein